MRAALFFGAVAKSFKLSAAGCGYFPTLFCAHVQHRGKSLLTIYLATRLCAVSATLLIIFLYLCSLSRLGRRVCVIEIARACR